MFPWNTLPVIITATSIVRTAQMDVPMMTGKLVAPLILLNSFRNEFGFPIRATANSKASFGESPAVSLC